MIFPLIIRPEAEEDIAEAYRWYEEQQEGVGGFFVAVTETQIQLIRENPRLYPVVRKTIRRALLRRFPYGIFYQFDGQKVTVFAVMHCSRNPAEWQERI